jgi:hypothetical protein
MGYFFKKETFMTPRDTNEHENVLSYQTLTKWRTGRI